MENQELKDKLWRLDDDVETFLTAISRATGNAWKAVVEHENHRRELEHAANLARDLWNRINATLEEV